MGHPLDSPVDSIAAIATAPGRGAVGMVRVSGPLARPLCEKICGIDPAPRHAYFRPFHGSDGVCLDTGIAIYFASPNSYTGEDVLELQAHGGPIVLDLILKNVLAYGCRLARPGEFTERAFLNDKMDLTQAEAVSDLIESGSEAAAKAAMRSLQGEFAERINDLLQQLITVRIHVESALDFPEEEIDFLSDPALIAQFEALRQTFSMIKEQATQGRLLREGMRVVISGEPNVGKSSLLNTLSGNDAAIVTPIAGTTRDTLIEQIHIDGLPLHIIDTAGVRESNDPIEQEGIRRALREIAKADRVLVMGSDEQQLTNRPEWIDTETPVDFIVNKIDLRGESARQLTRDSGEFFYLSAKTGEGVELLKTHLKNSMGYQASAEGTFMARRRHLDALQRAAAAVEHGFRRLCETGAGELCAEELRVAQQSLDEITGEFTSDDLLGKIFASFCIGK